jgi:ABC-type sugar transport system ATPase subunit
MSQPGSALLQAQDIDKHFGGVMALSCARFALHPGEVHALMGENGAGKSTLARILAGSLRADRGQIDMAGQPVAIDHPLDAQRLGIGIIYQELDLFPHLSVGENLVIGNMQFNEELLVSQRAIEVFCRPYLAQVGLDLDIGGWVASLSLAEQQLVAIARALSMRCRILLMDEPTSALSEDAAGRLFALIGKLKSDGVSVVYVSHKLEEIFRLCDRVTVLRDGETVGTREIATTDRAQIIRMMVGREVTLSTSAARALSERVALSVCNLRTGKLSDVSFDLHEGEVLGIAGLVGAGRSELGAALVGLEPIEQGSVTLNGQRFAPQGPAQAQSQGMGLVPEDRKRQGLMMHMSVRENCTLAVLSRLSRWGFLGTARERDLYDPTAKRLRLKAASPQVGVGTLSGGNQQKSLLARWLIADPGVLFLDDPARGIDVAAKEDIYRLIDELAASGKSILLASSELSELMRCSDRIMVLNAGRVAGIFSAREVTQEMIMAAATRATSAHPGFN